MNFLKVLKKYFAFSISVILLFSISIPCFAVNSDGTVKVGCFALNGFYDMEDNGDVSGYGAEYNEIIFNHAELNYEYVKYASWVEALDALSQNKIDVLAPAQHNAERDAKYSFDSFPIGTEYGTLLSLSTNDSLIYEDYERFNGLNVGCVGSLVFLDAFKEYEVRNGFAVNLLYYKDTPALLAALNAGEIDAIVANMMVKTDSMKLLARFGAAPFYYMFSNQSGDLKDKLDQSIDKVTSSHPELQNELDSKFFSDFDKVPFSKEEIDFIKDNGNINVACGSCYAPFSYLDEKTGQINGVDHAILEQIADISGLRFNYEPIPFDGGLENFVKDKNISIIAGVENDGNKKLHSSDFSESYLTISKYFIGEKNKELDTEVNLKIGIISSADAQIENWKKIYPKFEFERFESTEDCIKAVKTGKVDFLLDNRYSMEKYLSSPKNQNLKIFPEKALDSNICFKMISEDENSNILTSIINKSIKDITSADKEKYISEFAHENRYQLNVADFIYKYREGFLFAGLILMMIIAVAAYISKIRKKAREEIKENEIKLRNITNNINGGVVVLKANEGLNITFANDGFLSLIGVTREELEKDKNGSYLAYVHPDDLEKVHNAIESDKKELSLELNILRNDGTYIPALFNCTAGKKLNGSKELYCVIMDMSQQNKLIEDLRIEKRRTDLILDRVDEMFYEINIIDKHIVTSSSFYKKLGWKLPDNVPKDFGNNYLEMWHTDAENLLKLKTSTEEMYKSKKPVSTIVLMESKLEKRYIWCEVLQHPIKSKDGTIITIIGLIKDVDKQICEREKLIEQAQRDALTGLYNKEAFETIVTETLAKQRGQMHAIIFIDLDRFKSLNDTLGHMTGDRAICDAADKLKIIFSNYDIISRFGGDEFCVFVKNIPLETLRGKMEWLIEKIHETYRGVKGEVSITCSCGIACTDVNGYEYKELMQKADEALYYSKEHGRDQCNFSRDI